jgi:thioredoxin 1
MRYVAIVACLLVIVNCLGCGSAQPENAEPATSHVSITNADESTFESEVLQSDQPVLVDFWAEWCGPCKALAPVVDSIATEYEGRARVVKVDVDAAEELAAKYRIDSIPTLIVFRNGVEMQRIVGQVPKGEITSALDAAL